MITTTKSQIYYHTGEIELRMKPKYQLSYIRESNDVALVPRFSLKNSDIFSDVPSNTPLKPTKELILKAIKYGMILQIDYKGEEDDHFAGHERAIYPLIYGMSKDNNIIIRGYHLKGWSVSSNTNIEKVWRMFRFDRILNIVFTGAFFRLAPEGYKMDDPMNTVIARADFNDIRNLQQQLLNQDLVDTKDNLLLNKIKEIKVKDLKIDIKLDDLYEGNILKKKDARNTRITICKPVSGTGPYLMLVGIHVNKDQVFKVKTDAGLLGMYKTVENYMLNELETRFKVKELYAQPYFKLMLYVSAN